MSYQSDLLSVEDQKYLLGEVTNDSFLKLINEDPSILSHDDTTILIDNMEQYQDIKIPRPINTIPSNEEYSGPFEFEVDVIPNGAKNAWVYSPMLNKVYMDMRSAFPVDFKVKDRPPFPLFIRVTPMYSLPQYTQDCVYRCLNHEFTDDGTDRDISPHIKSHVIRCHNKTAYYIGEKSVNERLSVVIPLALPQIGTNSIREMFEFVCKNSCPSPGMNRRAIEVIFTLENEQSEIFGRKSLNVRVCSCPKRDKEKDEKDSVKQLQPSGGKKRKIQKPATKVAAVNHDVTEYDITIPIVGENNVKSILKFSHDLMAGEIERYSDDGPQAIAPFREVLNKLKIMIRDCNE
ncbi:tumor protein p73 isoform X1 [Diorhabda carinulata]|uniref:tumor protein p73 isoform X2 n=1 Tax=Diorhabda sublineata TaxID=1163346 RepID=UPI0024E05FD8|nr:tumor protein p73 isoform X2 [Diorhabda sublineata]XP_057659636.1 tumor protein p73 isoform X1 [Diorhabda carinulata]XP_057659637.1 tumor protein p73 isoform X1 [Diorhabda carinulata]